MVDYSKWKYLDITDDEDEEHKVTNSPYISNKKIKPDEEILDKDDLERARKMNQKKRKEIKDLLAEGERVDIAVIRAKLEELERAEEQLAQAEKKLRTKKRTSWTVAKGSHLGFTKTYINKPRSKKYGNVEDEIEKRMHIFVKHNRKQLKEFATLKNCNDCKEFLLEHPHLVCEDAEIYLVIWGITLQLEGKQFFSQHLARQCLFIHFILEMSKRLDADLKTCIISFFTKIQICDEEYKTNFETELNTLIGRIRKKAKEKMDIAVREQEAEDREARAGPGGLDPLEVFESLPHFMKECFEREDVSMLQKMIAELPEEEAAYHMKRCVDSGLWLPSGAKRPNRCYGELGREDTGNTSSSSY
ncbi:hsp90 co-chaperone Cdc37-like [Cimex lectularius]|uniref:Hsp90 co-chaperone Cdc37 n=1 Tax=Cimex lectularius TaxID=79782 RepID=A0A8I6RY50_CIMLE|nr:hsp90 co-chaperone Cdc37-like [Cimex lectularius]